MAVAIALAIVPACSSGATSAPARPSSSSVATTNVPETGNSTSVDGGGPATGPLDSTSAAAPNPGSTIAPRNETAPVDGNVPVGQLAPALLGASGAARLALEVRSQAGAEPEQASIDHVVSVLRQVSAKSVQLLRGTPIAGAARAWSSGDIAAAAADGAANSSGTVVVHLLFLRGTFGGDTSVLGAATRGDLAAVFSDQVRASADLVSGPQPIEVATATHEIGHLLGLVDLYLHTGRGDPQHPGHSTNQKSVMYWAVESSLVGSLLGQRPPADFDSSDLADLATIRNGA